MPEGASPPVVAADDAGLGRAARILRDGGLVAFPTETVYGLGGNACDDRAVARIFEAKGRPSFNPLIAHYPDSEAVGRDVVLDDIARRLADRFWPGPLTLVLPRAPESRLSELASAGLPTAAVRVPAHPVARALLARLDFPLAAPSANRSGEISPTRADHVRRSLGARVDLVVDGGPCAIGLESTIVDLTATPPVLLRHGGLPAETLAAVVGELADGTHPAPGEKPRSPGLLARHYAPSKPLRLDATSAAPDEALIAFGAHEITGQAVAFNLSPAGDLVEAAANLFAHLHAADASPAKRIAVMAIPERGLGRAINDRLRRAASGAPA